MGTSASTRNIALPFRVLKRIPVPHPVRILTSRSFKGSVALDDIDRHLLPQARIHKQAGRVVVLSGADLQTILDFLRAGGRQTFITGSKYENQVKRVIDPIREALEKSQELHLMQQVALYAGRGAVRATFLESGELDEEAFAAHLLKYGISGQDIPIIESVVREVIGDYWQRYLADSQTFHNQYPQVGRWLEPEFQPRTPFEQEGEIIAAGQLAALPLIGQERLDAIELITSRLAAEHPDILTRYEFKPGGNTTIDINRRGVSKALAIRVELARLGIPLVAARDAAKALEEVQHTVIFGGDEVSRRLNPATAEPVEGNDLSAFQVPNAFVLATNVDARGIPLETGRVAHIGSGPPAAFAMKNYIVTHMGKDPNDMPARITTPFTRIQNRRVPQQVSDVLSSRFEGAMLAIAASRIMGFRFEKDFKSVLVDPTAYELTRLLIAGAPIIIPSGGDHETRVIPLLTALKSILQQTNDFSALQNISFYSNGGALLTSFDEKGKMDEDVFSAHRDKYAITDPAQKELIAQILGKLRTEYLQHVGVEQHRRQYEQLPIVERKSEGVQFNLLPLLYSEKGWLTELFFEELDKEGVADQFWMHEGGYALDVTKAGADKRSSLIDARRRLNLEEDSPIIYLGGEFAQITDPATGNIRRHIDMGVLGLPGLYALGINENQSQVEEIIRLGYSGIFPAGSGTPALRSWLTFFNHVLNQ